MAKRGEQEQSIKQYRHTGKERVNNPPAGLVTPQTDPDAGGRKSYQYDPHIDPALQWAGKAERATYEVPTVSLHVHERIDPRTIIEAVRRRSDQDGQTLLFEEERDTPLRQEIQFYRHTRNWSNRLIAGDSLLVMNSLLQKESMAGKAQCVYIDPPYGIRYGSNFQPFVGKRDVKDGRDEDLTAEPEQIRAFRDTWELGIHSYLSYMRDRLLLARELLTESGSCFVQISDENVHLVRNVMDDIFGYNNHISSISYRVFGMRSGNFLDNTTDNIIWYGKNKKETKYRELYLSLDADKQKEFEPVRLYRPGFSKNLSFEFEFEGKKYSPPSHMHWATSLKGLRLLEKKNRLIGFKSDVRYKRYTKDFPYKLLTTTWNDTWGAQEKHYVVQTSEKVIQRCILMTTDPGDLIFDPTCGSGTTAYVAEQWGRRWITCDTSRVALALARQRLMTATFDYYRLTYPQEGVGSGFEYRTVPHITLRSIANEEPPATETLYDQPFKDSGKARVTGPFTVEAVPAPMAQPIDSILAAESAPADQSSARSGETLRQNEWRDELLKSGIRGRGGQRISFARIDSLPYRWLHAEAETRPDDSSAGKAKEATPAAHQPQRAVISFGPEHAPLESRQVEDALQEAKFQMPKPEIVIFAAFQFDPEAAKNIDETNWPGMTLLKAQMNTDLQTEDLKKSRASNESFWLIGQPDVEIKAAPTGKDGKDEGMLCVEVRGFDYFDIRSGKLQSGSDEKIAIWMLDTDYDGRCLYPRQVFFPMAESKGGWSRLAKDLKAEIDEGLMEAYRGTRSLPFKLGEHRRIAVKIVDDRGIESLRVMEI